MGQLVEVLIAASLCGRGGKVEVKKCDGKLDGRVGLVVPDGMEHFCKMIRDKVEVDDFTKDGCAKLLLDLAGEVLPVNYSVATAPKYDDHQWTSGGWEATPNKAFAFPLLERKPYQSGDLVIQYEPLVRKAVVDQKVLTVEYLVVVQRRVP